MTTITKEVYDAFRSAGATEAKASAAAEALTELRDEPRLRGIEFKLTEIDGRFTLLQWMVGFNLAMSAAILFKILL